ncbi:MAG TPA: ATP-binding protein [Jiangellaceae bacterium]
METGQQLVQRHAEKIVVESLGAFRAVVLHGPRQAGKTTLARLIANRLGVTYTTMDDDAERAAAQADPDGYVAAYGPPLVLDEIQRAGEPLVLAVKSAVDRDPRPGRFLLTGSSNFLTVPAISETLAGRTDIVELWPLAQSELNNSTSFVDRVLSDGADAMVSHNAEPAVRKDYFDLVCRGGFPEARAMTERSRRRWFSAYLKTVLDREITDSRDIRDREALESMVRYFAATTAQELVMTRVANRLGIARDTAERYQPWLERVFLIQRTPGWGRGLTSKIVQRPKIYMIDTGLAAALIGRDSHALLRPTEPAAGPLLETLVAGELTRQLSWSDTEARLFHLREREGREVDLVIETADGRVIGIEVKAATTARSDDFKGLTFLRDRLDLAGVPFLVGIVLHTGPHRHSFGDRLAALPISDLWR